MEQLLADCPYIDDVVLICIDDEQTTRRAQVGWFGRFLLAVAEAFP